MQEFMEEEKIFNEECQLLRKQEVSILTTEVDSLFEQEKKERENME